VRLKYAHYTESVTGNGSLHRERYWERTESDRERHFSDIPSGLPRLISRLSGSHSVNGSMPDHEAINGMTSP